MQTRATANTDWDAEDGEDFEPERVAAVGNDFERGAAFQGLWISVRSQELRSGRVTAALSGVTVDLREAVISPEGATLYVQAALSGVDILVPPGCDVVCDVDAICSGVRENWVGSKSDEPRPRLRITGMVVAGGLSVR